MELGGRAQPLAEALIQGKGAALTPTDQLLAMASGAGVTQRSHVAAERGVADQLAGGEQSVESLGLFQETTPRQFARMLGEEHYLSWDDLLHSVRSGENAFRHRYGCSVFEWYQQQPQRAEIFDGAMGDFSRPETDALLATYDFAGGSHLVDVAGADGYLLKHILHDWGDDACLQILAPIRAGRGVVPPLRISRPRSRAGSTSCPEGRARRWGRPQGKPAAAPDKGQRDWD